MSDKEKKSGCTCSCAMVTVLSTVILVALKLTGAISWSWWWVLSPFILYFGVVSLIALFCIGFLLIALSVMMFSIIFLGGSSNGDSLKTNYYRMLFNILKIFGIK